MNAPDIILIIGALVTLVGAVAGAAIAIIHALHETKAVTVSAAVDAAQTAAVADAKLDGIHVLVNGNLAAARAELAHALALLHAAGVIADPTPAALAKVIAPIIEAAAPAIAETVTPPAQP